MLRVAGYTTSLYLQAYCDQRAILGHDGRVVVCKTTMWPWLGRQVAGHNYMSIVSVDNHKPI